MHESFIETLIKHIMEARMIPKVQVERAVGPILSMFLADVLTETLSTKSDMSGVLTMICPEFPFKKSGSKQSTNIDWLMYNKTRQQILFVELKTSDTSVNTNQTTIYRAKQEDIQKKGGLFLIEDLKKMRDASTEYGKYQYILEKKILPYQQQLSACHDARILYIVPKSAAHKVTRHADIVLSFGELSASISGAFADEWRTIQSHLCTLDKTSKQSRNRSFTKSYQSNQRLNYEGRYDFNEIIDLCEKQGDNIVVGFMGGVNELASRDMNSLKKRKYKWDSATGGVGKKRMRNWIYGNTFSKIISNKKEYSNRTSNKQDHSTVQRSSKWQGTFKFPDMIEHCIKHGNKIIIGFTGGKAAFARSKLSYLQQRSHYKWDYATNLAGKNQSDWLFGETVLELLKRYHNYPQKR